jgi:hypothetical protein
MPTLPRRMPATTLPREYRKPDPVCAARIPTECSENAVTPACALRMRLLQICRFV